LLNRSFTNGQLKSSRIEAIRKAQRGEGIDLDRKNAAALAGQWYEWFVAQYEKEDADPEVYEEALWDIIDAMREFAPEEVRQQPLKDMKWARDPEVRQGVRAVVADLGHTTQFLASRGLALTHKAHAVFLDRVLDNYLPARCCGWSSGPRAITHLTNCRNHFPLSHRSRSALPQD
jgi:hypothetical protein